MVIRQISGFFVPIFTVSLPRLPGSSPEYPSPTVKNNTGMRQKRPLRCYIDEYSREEAFTVDITQIYNEHKNSVYRLTLTYLHSQADSCPPAGQGKTTIMSAHSIPAAW